jgi:hypothetical protein
MLLVFVFFCLINIASSGGHFDWWDGNEAFFVTESMVLKHTSKLDPSVPSVEKLHFDIRYSIYSNLVIQGAKNLDKNTLPLVPVYTVRSLLLSAIAVPFYYAALIFSVSPIAVIGIFFNSLLISLTAVLVFCLSLDVFRSKKIAFILSLIFGVCSFVWPYNTSFWTQPLQALTLIASAFFIFESLHYSSSFICHYTRPDKNKGVYFAGLGGLFLGLSVFAHPTSIVFVPGFIAYCAFSMRRTAIRNLVSFTVILGITLFFMGVVNYLRFGSFTEFGYGYFASLATHDGWKGLIGLLISPGAGLLFYFPIAILLPLGTWYMYKEHKALFLLSVYIIILNWLDVGTLSFGFEPFAWSGAIAWGPRYLIPVLPFMIIIIGNIFTHLKKRLSLKISIVVLCAAGFVINLAGVLVWYQYGIIYGWEKEQLAKYPNNMDIMTWNPSYSPIILHMKSLASDHVSTIHPEKYLNTFWYWTAYGLAPCSYDSYIFCKFGIIPILLIAAAIAAVAIMILREAGALTPYSIIHRLNFRKILRSVDVRS